MIRHVVMFGIQGNGELSPTEEARRLGDMLLALPAQIPFIKKMEVGVNSDRAPVDNAQLVLIVDFDSIEDCAMYSIHPAHLAVAEEIGKVKTSRSCVDYEI
ncbi:MAG: Dabb family protein [Lachnospiraceae bacterium]|nr:Dabb family protein [Lachnospiraceae bacterium]